MVEIMKTKWFVLFGILLYLTTIGCSSAGNGKIAVLQNSAWKWSNGWPDSDCLSQESSYVSALDFYGYKYDVLNYGTTTDTKLSPYEAVIAVRPMNSQECNLVINYTEKNHKYAFVSRECGGELGIKHGLTWLAEVASYESVDPSSFNGPISAGLDELGVWYYTLYLPGLNSTVNVRNMAGDPLLVTSTVNGGTCVFFLNRVTSVSSYNYRMIKNFCDVATNNMPVVTGSTPYAKDLVIMVRYDDLFTDPTSFKMMYNISHDCTVADVLQSSSKAAMGSMPLAEMAAHCYDHVDLTTLTYQNVSLQMSKARTREYQLIKVYPKGVISPYNNLNDDVTRAAAANNYNWATWTGAVMDDPCHVYSSDVNNFNKIWVLGDEGVDLMGFVNDPATLSHYETIRRSLMITEHPNQRYEEGVLPETLNALSNLIINSKSTDGGIYFSNVSDYVDHLNDARNVMVKGNTITVSKNTKPGLTFEGASSNLVLGNRNVTILQRNNKVLLPALSKGSYSYSTSNSYPHIISSTNNSCLVVIDGSYDIMNNKMYFKLNRNNELFITTDVTISVPNNQPYHLSNGTSNTTLIPTNGVLTAYNLPQGNYTLVQ